MALVGSPSYNKAIAVTKSDTLNFDGSTYSANPTGGGKPIPCEALYVGGAGIVVAIFEDGSNAQFTCVAGQILPLKLIRVNSATTTATLMVALYQI
jgi:hypothetical protein